MPGWFDAMCRIVTGDAQVTCALYPDEAVNVLTCQRPVLRECHESGGHWDCCMVG
jgi:hypothetical protein